MISRLFLWGFNMIAFDILVEKIKSACCKKKERFIQPIPKNITNDYYWSRAVVSLSSLKDKYGINNMIAALPQALEDMQEESILMYGESHYETELYKNRDFAIAVLDRAMNCCDIDEDNATRFDRLQQVEKMIEALKEYKGTL